jgi:EF hand
MSFKSRTLIAGAAITLLSTSAVWAQSTAPAMGGATPAPAAAADKPMSAKDMAAAFTKADTNKDGKLDKMEAEGVPGLAAKFEQVDADGDKTVSKAEFEKGMK